MNPFTPDGQDISMGAGDKPPSSIEYDFMGGSTFQGASVDGETLLDPTFDSSDNMDAFLPASLDTSFPIGDQQPQIGNLDSLGYQQSQNQGNIQSHQAYDKSLLQKLDARRLANIPSGNFSGNPFSPNASNLSFPSPVSAPVNFTRTDIDMNDPIKLELYSQILLFRDDANREELFFSNPDHEKQEVLSKIAHGLGLECEYRLRQRQTVISRPILADPIDLLDLDEFNQATGFPLAGNSAKLNNVDIHSQVKSYLCKCGKSFSRYDILTRHRWRGICVGALDYSKRASNMSLGSDLDVLDDFSFDNSINLVSHPHSITKTVFTDYLPDPPAASAVNRTSIENPNQPIYSEAESIRSRETSIDSTKDARHERTKTLIGRASSADGSPSFQEIIFDSKSGNNPRWASAPRGRRGPLDKMKRAGIETLRAMGACWRCKILRRQCDPYNPCKACPESLKDKTMPKKSEWQIIGCRRGAIQTEISPILLCPQSIPNHSVFPSTPQTSTQNNPTTTSYEHANTYLRESNDQRRKDIQDKLSAFANHKIHVSLLEINWELEKHPGVRSKLLHEIVDLPALLEYAAEYQALFNSDQLIKRSFDCLKSCTEALKLRESGYLSESTHDTCKSPSCLVDCISNLELQISSYIDELSQVIFKKENRKDPQKWWLPAFYSLCVQSFVRRGLIILIDDSASDKEGSAQKFNVNQYLWLAVRLFGVGSATYDPLVASLSSKAVLDSPEDKRFASHHESAKASVKSELWEQHGIIGSRECLKKLFDDDGTPIADITKHDSSLPTADLSDLYSSNSLVSIPNSQDIFPPPLPPLRSISGGSARPDNRRSRGKEQWQSPYASESDVSSIQSYGHRDSFDQDNPSYDHGFPLEETSGLRRLHIENSSQGSLAGSKRRASSPPRDNMVNTSGFFRRRETSITSPVHPAFYSHDSWQSRSKRRGSYASGHSLAGSVTSLSSYGRLSPGGLSGSDAEDAFFSSRPRPRMFQTSSPPGSLPTRAPFSSKERLSQTSIYICECCLEKPKKFDTKEELIAHEGEKQYACAYCKNRFKNKNVVERHQNRLHLRKYSWSCATLTSYAATFHSSSSDPTEDICGYCGTEFPRATNIATEAEWESRIKHLTEVHKFGECNHAKKFFRADHFRQHLKHSHNGMSGKWTNMLENTCMKEEPLPEPLKQPDG